MSLSSQIGFLLFTAQLRTITVGQPFGSSLKIVSWNKPPINTLAQGNKFSAKPLIDLSVQEGEQDETNLGHFTLTV